MSDSPRPKRTWMRRALLLVLWLLTLAAAFYVGVLAHRHRARIRSMLGSFQETAIIQTNLYNLRSEKFVVEGEGRDGGIAPLGDGVLFVNRLGRFWFIDSGRAQHALQLTVPVNVDEFLADPYNEQTIHRELFGVKDLMVLEDSAGIVIYASHNHWHANEDCYGLRISRLETTRDRVLDGTADSSWSTVYETSPCHPLTTHPNGRNRNPTLAAGGRMVPMPDGRVLVTIGGFGPETDLTGADPSLPFGKTILVDPTTGEARAWTQGHRNPQGLARAPDGTVWLTEHGDRGGDELNRLEDGVHYGYPHVSYGTAYGAMTWPSNPVQGRHDGYRKPMFAWTPGIGASQVVAVSGDALPYWNGDLLVASLTGMSLFRVRVEDDRVVFVEPIPIGHRIRDVTQMRDGTIVLKTDDNHLVFLSPVGTGGAADAALSPEERGAVVAAQCQGCHTLTPGGANAIGPALHGVVGRDIAGADGYAYSDALRRLDGNWTPELLRAFLARPDSVAPGTTMQMPQSLDADQIADLVAYLRTLD